MDPERASEAKELGQQLDILLNAHLLQPGAGHLDAATRVADDAIEKYYDLAPIPRSADELEVFEAKQAKADMLPLQLYRLGVMLTGSDEADVIWVTP